ncbi:25S rRNA (adenine(2142)-N(1))-methyltransferase, Bmt2 [Plasmopara halstedii]|uniref:25S rRNA (Adenine(2142)-N(1))-methyltransferase, Bmt2 n=1 Tax=Plasmopara halstedii TaxID=4781 RepID=A0A0P1A697_PLAHL|nr:25S rRNA (adenine(2142)-N(1))-methyltransferase, Bmt2 [Plasmopara halstedii]CEG35688.1 25S rRNA (adenine(2142)-N(1))-methyltransferase, Bmt2 [Plasmopara halstedii]|eukprot:XP_024572057.1 25S rRNA (adenine(2142)-N(1))-methyltransferase, Bmt2 [Plasmopara halstedii]
MGGRQAYQDASILSTSFYLGAINTQLLSCPWLIVRAIDLKYRHKRIEQCDFFSLKPAGEFVSSVVLNCTPGAVKRGQMLRMYREHLMDGGLLFLIVASTCIKTRMTTPGTLETTYILKKYLPFVGCVVFGLCRTTTFSSHHHWVGKLQWL